MLKIGLTGGIGSGKTYISGVFRELGIPVYHADAEAKRIMENDPAVRRLIKSLLGPESYINGKLNREYIGQVVFSDKKKLEALNSIVHPAVQQDFNNWSQDHSEQPYIIKEAAILFEAGGAEEMDHTIFVKANIETRIARVVERDQVSELMVMDRIDKQMDDHEKEKLADFVINNEIGSMILPQIVDLHNKFLKINS
jgi:dephospho-CoA kinase